MSRDEDRLPLDSRTQAVIDGTWESQQVWHGIREGMVKIGEISDAVPAEVKAEALALAEADPSVEAGVNTVEVAEIMGGVTG